ncbi:MAG: hypothetical protein ACKO3P_02025, partial [Planctomycetaceae bacterium]
RYDPIAAIQSRNVSEREGGTSFGERQVNQRAAVVNPSLMTPRDFPPSPEMLCGVDLVLLSPEGVLGLKEPQLAALTDWVRAGGSLCARVPVGEPVTPAALAFLNSWASEPRGEPRYLILPGQRELTLIEPETQAPSRQFQKGLGRVVLIEEGEGLEELTRSSEWLRNVGFLWHLRSERVEELIRSHPNPRWTLPDEGEILDLLKVNQFMANAAAANEQRWNNLLSKVVQELQPQAVTELPVGRFLAALVLFFLVVIPGDYFGLGAIRSRRWTWVFVPLCSILFAWGISSMADAVMGPKGFTHELVISDLDSAGQPVRRSVLNLKMVSAPQIVEQDLKNQVYANLTRYQRQRSENGSLSQGRNRGPRQKAQAMASFRGEMPGEYTVAESLSRWSPVLTRVTSLGAGELGIKLNWEEIRQLDWRDISALRASIRAVEPQAEVMLLTNAPPLVAEAAASPSEVSNRMTRLAVELTSGRHQLSLLGTNASPLRLNMGGSPQQMTGWFHVVEQTSPTGSGNLEDLRVEGVEEENSGRELLLIIVPGQEQTTVYRWHRMITR